MRPSKSDLKVSERERLRRFFNSCESDLKFLAYEVNLDTGEIRDGLRGRTLPETGGAAVLWTLLKHFSKAEPREKTGKLIGFRNLPGGYAYDKAFTLRAT